MIEQLFGSKTRVKLLGLFYQNPDRSYYVREITRKIDEQINSVRRELANLLSIGIISSDNSNNKLYYEVNKDFEHYDALSAMFGGRPLKATATDSKDLASKEDDEMVQLNTATLTYDDNVEAIVKSGNVRLLIYTGKFTRDETSGVDVVIVGDINIPNLDNAINKLEEAEKKEIRYSVFSPDEFDYRRKINDRFVTNVIGSKKIIHVNKDQII